MGSGLRVGDGLAVHTLATEEAQVEAQVERDSYSSAEGCLIVIIKCVWGSGAFDLLPSAWHRHSLGSGGSGLGFIFRIGLVLVLAISGLSSLAWHWRLLLHHRIRLGIGIAKRALANTDIRVGLGYYIRGY